MKNNEKELYKFVDKFVAFIEKLPPKDRSFLASTIIEEAAYYGGRNHYESIGILQCTMLSMQREKDNYIAEKLEEKTKRKGI
jgi:hypothetical protein